MGQKLTPETIVHNLITAPEDLQEFRDFLNVVFIAYLVNEDLNEEYRQRLYFAYGSLDDMLKDAKAYKQNLKH